MSKKTPVKKSKRRLKRSVRRSLATALMITAIAVAAIPVPENYAEDGSNPGSGTNTPAASTAEAYKYPDADTMEGYAADYAAWVDTDGVKLKNPNPNTKYTTHFITRSVDPNGAVSYSMEWQFEYFLQKVNNLDRGIISNYNDSFPVSTLVVSINPIHEYVVIPSGSATDPGTFEKFKSQHQDDPFSLQEKPDENDPQDQRFKKYFPDDYNAQVERYKKYEEDKASYPQRLADYQKKVQDAYDALGGIVDEETLKNYLGGETAPEEPKKSDYWNVQRDLERTAADFSAANDDYFWRLYYCDRQKASDVELPPGVDPDGPDVSRFTSLEGYILVRVTDSEKGLVGGVAQSCFVPQKIDPSQIDLQADDELGFKIRNWTSFIGIGDEAFKGVHNVQNIELPDALRYIGESAFEDSFIRTVKMMNLKSIGNYAFKNCPNLSSVEMVQGVEYIGTETFYGLTNVREIKFPSPIKYIGAGAFANCALLSKVDFSAATTEVIIDDYAFYNDGALSEVNFMLTGTNSSILLTTMGKCAFAVWDGVSGSLTEFIFPEGISGPRTGKGYNSRGLGDYVLAGRTNLKDVTMPGSYGRSSETELPGHIFQNCIALERVNFPDNGQSCGFVTFPKDLFASVSNPNFYVQGPPYTQPSSRDPALPRKSTWVAYSAVAATKDGARVPNIPYVYYWDGVRYTEICDGKYLMCIDENGVLISCSLHPDEKAAAGTIDLVIPAEVAGTVVTGIASDCFAGDANEPDNRKLSIAVRTLTIMDGSQLATINNNVFANWVNLERAYLGDSVRTVGDNAFQACESLVDVYFNTPDSAAAEFKMGTNAFQTQSQELTFHGPISTDYAPYQFAVLSDTVISTDGRGKRICYKSLTPTYFTVMRDNGTSEPTLLDYPKYDQIASILGEAYAVKNGEYVKAGYVEYNDENYTLADYYSKYWETTYYNLYSSTQFDNNRAKFKADWQEKGEAVYDDFEVYGPWVNQAWIDSPQGFGGGTSSGSTSSDSTENASGGSAIADFFFEPLIVQAAETDAKPLPYFDVHPYDVYENLERTNAYGDYQRATLEEYNLLNATRNITVPDGVTSIDVRAFLTRQPNSPNLSYVDSGKVGKDSYNMYTDHHVSTITYDRTTDLYAGLFSGEYTDYKGTTTDKENLNKGNDRLESVDLNQVTSLPDYAFDSCENLRSVTIGADCTDIKKLPFRGCTSLTTLNVAEENPKYTAENRILYAKNDTSSYTILECLESRGRNNDNSVVTSAIDVNLSLVTSIAEGAFEECDNVTTINLSDATGLTVIPERAFMDCDALDEVDLPLSVNKIDKDAFKDNVVISRVKIPGREVFISTNAFNDVAGKTQKTRIITYEDSSARRYADTYGDEYKLLFENIGELWDVNFYDYDGTLLKAMQVQDGWAVKTSEIPEATREGFKFLKWVGTNNVDVQDEITQDTDFIATYSSNSQMVNGKWFINFIDGVTGDPFWPTQYVEDGESIADSVDADFPPTQPYHEGYKFTKYVANIGGKAVDFTENTEVTSNLSVVALFAVDGAGNSGGNGTTSGSTTNNGGNSGNTGNTSGSTTNTSGSSTSTTSSTGATPRHTVTVVNGYGSGSYAEGETVIIVANEPAEGQKFSQWRTESEGVELVMILASATTFVMPANNVLVTAEFTAGSVTPTTTALQTPASGTVATNTGNGTTGNSSNNGNTRVDITKPGISNKNLATANTNGSTDNFIVKISETPEATQAVQNALTNKYGSLDNILYYAMDISLYDSTGTTKITDTTGLSVDITIPLPDALVAYGGNNMMGAVVGSDQLEDMSERFTTIGGVPCISFTATHFSPYTIYVNTQNLSEGLLDVTPKTGDPIHPKWFLSIGMAALSIILFMKKDKKTTVKTA